MGYNRKKQRMQIIYHNNTPQQYAEKMVQTQIALNLNVKKKIKNLAF